MPPTTRPQPLRVSIRHRIPIAHLPRRADIYGVPSAVLTAVLWLWPIPVLLLVWRFFRRLPSDTESEPEPAALSGRSLRVSLDALDWFSLSILLGLFLLVWIGRNSIFPVPPDSYYHLMVARKIYQSHSVPLWNSWEWAPLGRPHLYPPLYHVLLAVCALPFHGDLLAAFRNLQPAMLPFAHLTTWYLARWLFDSRRAFIALLIVGMDPVLVTSSALGMPGVLVTSWVSLLVVFFLARRWVLACAMLTLAFYTHLGIPALTLVGLGLFCLVRRQYLAPYLAMTLPALALASPWLIRVYVFRDWFTHPLDAGLYGIIDPWRLPFLKLTWLQMIDLFIVLLVVLAAPRIRWRETRNLVLICLLLGFLPMLFSYGGRFYIHTVHVWAIFAALPFMGFLGAPVRWRRVAAVCLFALSPAPSLIGTGTPYPPGVYPVPSAWMVGPFVAGGGLRLLNGGAGLGFASLDDCRTVAEAIRKETEPDQIVYLTWDRDLGVAIGYLSDHPIDTGAWEETMPDEPSRNLIRWYAFKDPTPCYVSRVGYGIPHQIEERQIGSMYVGFKAVEPVGEAANADNAKKERRDRRREKREAEDSEP